MKTEEKIDKSQARKIVTKRPNGSRRVQYVTAELTMTQQHFKDECDINKILAKYAKTGQLPDMIKKNPIYGDFAESVDYHEAMNTMLLAQEQFANLPAEVRKRFQNEPQEFLEFANNPENLHEMVKLGLATYKPGQEPTEANNPPSTVSKTEAEPKK